MFSSRYHTMYKMDTEDIDNNVMSRSAHRTGDEGLPKFQLDVPLISPIDSIYQQQQQQQLHPQRPQYNHHHHNERSYHHHSIHERNPKIRGKLGAVGEVVDELTRNDDGTASPLHYIPNSPDAPPLIVQDFDFSSINPAATVNKPSSKWPKTYNERMQSLQRNTIRGYNNNGNKSGYKSTANNNNNHSCNNTNNNLVNNNINMYRLRLDSNRFAYDNSHSYASQALNDFQEDEVSYRPASDQHYQHYCSYFDRNELKASNFRSRKAQNLKKSERGHEMKVFHKFMSSNDYENYLMEPLNMESAQRQPARATTTQYHLGNINNNSIKKINHKVLRDKAYNNNNHNHNTKHNDIDNNNHPEAMDVLHNNPNWTVLHSHNLEDLNKASGDFLNMKVEGEPLMLKKKEEEEAEVAANKTTPLKNPNESGAAKQPKQLTTTTTNPTDQMINQFVQQKQQQQQYQYQQYLILQQHQQSNRARKQRTYSDSDIIDYDVTSFKGKYSPSDNNITVVTNKRLSGGRDVPLKPLDMNLQHFPGDKDNDFATQKNDKGAVTKKIDGVEAVTTNTITTTANTVNTVNTNANVTATATAGAGANANANARIPSVSASNSRMRRVLLYSSQSPRMTRPFLSINRSRQRMQMEKMSSMRVNNENNPKTKTESGDANENANSAAAAASQRKRIRVLESMSPVKPGFDMASGARFHQPLSSRIEHRLPYANIVYDDDLDEDDMDNVSVGSEDSELSTDSEEGGYRSYAYKLTHSTECAENIKSFLSYHHCEADTSNPPAVLVASLFPNVPPYIAFSSNKSKGPDVPPDLFRVLKWRTSTVMPRVVRLILSNSGMRILKKTNDWMGIWGKHMKSNCFRSLRGYQKINHLPGSFRIGRKDSCWRNLVKLTAKYGKREFGFMPKTFIIPHDLKQLRRSWPRYSQKNVKWILKPPASARGAGIRVVDRWAQIPKRRPLIVQKYIERPLLINGSKFDLRLYVLVTSINPLRVYMYHDGLARFASVKYSDKSDTLYDRCMHLTNYSINKLSSNYAKNEDVNACHGHKWTIKSLWNYLSSRGVRIECLWEALRNLVLRTILAGENSMNNIIRNNTESPYTCFELFGFDVLLDADLVPWLLEVNISPSLHSELPLDSHVKGPLVRSVLNAALYNVPPKLSLDRQMELAEEMSLPPGPICFDKRIYSHSLSRHEKIKHHAFTAKKSAERSEYLNDILSDLTPDDIRCLIVAEDELVRSAPLERIFPTAETHKYLKFTDSPRYYNRLLDAWETRYSKNREEGIKLLRGYCKDKYHLQVPTPPPKKENTADGGGDEADVKKDDECDSDSQTQSADK